MAPPASSQTLLSPAELSFIHSSLSLPTPIRPDLRTPTQFRPLVAETDILPAANGSARICFSDGTEAVVGVKAELEKTPQRTTTPSTTSTSTPLSDSQPATSSSWLNLTIDIPGHRDDDPLPVFLASMLTEALLADSALLAALHLNPRWHWKLHIDVLLLSPPLSYPLPLLSLTTHLALRAARLPARTSPPADDPTFDDDWAAALPLYPEDTPRRPPATLLVMTVADNVVFDPSREELAVADAVLAVSFAPGPDGVRLLALRAVDPPSRLTPPGVRDAANPAIGVEGQKEARAPLVRGDVGGMVEGKEAVWSPPRGGVKRALLKEIVRMVVEPGGVGEEVLEGLGGVEV